ncbi:MAG: DUF368 domain-containing protein [Flavobacteriales bacterium]|nr:DUF368 domain-containing protein [Flavobacteriales bacterium]NNK80355.1 DUF368 domain-containing protein [Flavobacteriales bacterium]
MSKSFFGIFTRGLAMGAADVVPGVSGGTIAFITGIYEELVDSIGRIDIKALRLLFKEGIKSFFIYINGKFLISLLLGIGLSIVLLARFITYLLATFPIVVWAFFFGLILASAVFIGRDMNWKKSPELLAFAIGILIAYSISTMTPSGTEVSLVYVFVSGAIAICAMILPGISGSFILLLLGSYSTVFGAIGHFTEDVASNAPIIAAFGIGAIIGLLSFSKLLKYLFQNHRAYTIAVLTGFMLGSLAKVWPWKETLSTRINSKGEEVPLLQNNISPLRFQEITGGDSQIFLACISLIIGIAIVYFLARVDDKSKVARA